MANDKHTSKEVATKAAKILPDDRYSAKSKSVAGSALSQAAPQSPPQSNTPSKDTKKK